MLALQYLNWDDHSMHRMVQPASWAVWFSCSGCITNQLHGTACQRRPPVAIQPFSVGLLMSLDDSWWRHSKPFNLSKSFIFMMIFKAPEPEVEMCRLYPTFPNVFFEPCLISWFFGGFFVYVFESIWLSLHHLECVWCMLNALNVSNFADFCGMYWTLLYPRLVWKCGCGHCCQETGLGSRRTAMEVKKSLDWFEGKSAGNMVFPMIP